jgi:putative tryptophan/tyrosine transport system substrate-binding protein
MKRREFIAVLGGAAIWPLAAHAQQPMPVVGFLNPASPQGYARQLAAFLKGLGETGFTDGQNVKIEYRWAEGQNDRLRAMAEDLVRRKVAVIAATSTPAALAAKAATITIPIIFETGGDPIDLGLVFSLSRPGANLTGVTQTNVELVPKRLQLMHELLPTARVMAFLANSADGSLAAAYAREAQKAAQTLGLEVHVLDAGTDRALEEAFAKLSQLRAAGLVVGGGAFLTSRSVQIATLALRQAVPAIFQGREFAAAGGLVSYGSDIAESYRLAGVYTCRILKGEQPANLPVQQATKVEFSVNLKTAKALGITVPLPLSGRADELIE